MVRLLCLGLLAPLAGAVPTNLRGAASLQTINQAEPTVGWTEINNGNMPLGRGTSGICSGPWGILVFGGELSEHFWTSQTLLLERLGGEWQVLSFDEGAHPSARSNPGMARFTTP